jgi:hypothetical protein
VLPDLPDGWPNLSRHELLESMRRKNVVAAINSIIADANGRLPGDPGFRGRQVVDLGAGAVGDGAPAAESPRPPGDPDVDLRRRVAAEAGLPAELASRLRGESEEALRADAAALAPYFAPAPASLPSIPRGTIFDPQAGTVDGQIGDAERAGDWEMAGRLKAVKLDLPPIDNPIGLLR